MSRKWSNYDLIYIVDAIIACNNFFLFSLTSPGGGEMDKGSMSGNPPPVSSQGDNKAGGPINSSADGQV